MGKIAFVFSGQGDQYPGMGKDLYDRYPEAREVFEGCDRIRSGTSDQCFFGTEEELKETRNTQPCLFAMELATAHVLMEKGIRPSVTAGFSLGEIAAATVSGIFEPADGFRLVCLRGELMQREAERYDTSMAAVLRLTAEQVEAISQNYSQVYPVNFNCPGQITVSGLTSQMQDFYREVKAAGGRALPLKVKGAFHSPFMDGAAEAFAEELAGVDLRQPIIPLYSNMTARPYSGDSAYLLSQQISHPVQWESLIRHMIDDQVDTFVEIGPGRTLTNMIRKISSGVKAMNGMDYLTEAEQC